MKKILAVDDDKAERVLLESMLGSVLGYEVQTANSGKSALDQVGRIHPDAVILDLRLQDMDGLDVLRGIKQSQPSLPVIMLTGFADVRTAVEAIQMGAHDYLTKPFDDDQLLLALRQAIEKNDLLAEMERSRKKGGSQGPCLARIDGRSLASQEVTRQIQAVADSSLTILIQGETGTGKEPAARALHEEGSRRDRPFVAVDCGALPENLLESELFGHEKGAFSGADRKKQGQFELADGGTLFLDEIGNLPISLQAKLLRTLQERQVRPVGAARAFPVNVRIIAATNIFLEGAARCGQFRQDLYYRLAEFTLRLPPLRSRREDILPLAQRFQEEACLEFQRKVTSFSGEAAKRMEAYSWPGNVRELRNVVRQAVLLAPDSAVQEEQIQALLGSSTVDGPTGALSMPAFPPGTALRQIVESAVEQVERKAILDALRSAGGNKSHAAQVLEVDYKTLRLKIKKYGLKFTDG